LPHEVGEMMSAAPSVSVVIPTFERRQSVIEAVVSALAQTRGEVEVIVVDDGSTDGTDAAVSAIDERVKVARRPNGGPAAARNTGIRHARAPLLAFLDSDDRWHPRHLEEMLRLLDSYPGAVLACTGGATRGADSLKRSAGVTYAAPAVLLGGLLYTSAVAVRRDAIEAVGGFDESLRVTEDADLWCRLSLEGPFVLGRVPTLEAGEQPTSLREEGRLAGLYPAAHERVADRFVRRVSETASRRPLAESRRLARAGRGTAAAARAIGELVAGEPRRAEGELASAWRLFPELSEQPDLFVRRLERSHPRWHEPEERERVLAWLAGIWPGVTEPREELVGEHA
jgi:glycosyltransferase involved in cell wall biosynthesis